MAADRKPTSAAVTEPAETMSYEEFLTRYDGESAEWVDGRVVPLSPISDKHDRVVGFLHTILDYYVQEKGIGRVLQEPFSMKLETRPSGRSPDIIFVAADRLGRIRHNHLDGPADLAIEVISPDSRRRDRREKYAEYERAGVTEYWVIDPHRKVADFYLLGPDGRFQPAPPDADGIYRSTVMDGVWIDVAWLWDPPRRSVPVRAWGL